MATNAIPAPTIHPKELVIEPPEPPAHPGDVRWHPQVKKPSEVPAQVPQKKLSGPRVITRESGFAINALAHAAEYLTDEATFNERTTEDRACDVEAVQLLKRLNREIYFALPVRATIWDKWFGPAAEQTPRPVRATVIPFPVK
jgi:hypothetical protein